MLALNCDGSEGDTDVELLIKADIGCTDQRSVLWAVRDGALSLAGKLE
jgi:hypothetical protein